MQPRSSRRALWLASLAILAGSILLFFGVTWNRRDRVTLPNGITIEFLGVTHGTNDFVDGNFLQKLLGDRIPENGVDLGFTTLTRPEKFHIQEDSEYICWVRVSDSKPISEYSPHWTGLKATFSNRNVRELKVPYPVPRASSSSNALFAISMDAFPRDQSDVMLRIGTPERVAKQQWAEFEFANPRVVKELSEWKLQSLPATNLIRNSRVILRSANAAFSTLRFTLPSSVWLVPEAYIFDQEGNRYSWSGYSRPTSTNRDHEIHFPYSFGSDRPWHARVTFVRARYFVKSRYDDVAQLKFPKESQRCVTLSVDGPPSLITNNIGEAFTCVLYGDHFAISGSTSERPYWAVISARSASKEVTFYGYRWVTPSRNNPAARQVFFLPNSVTNLTLELACPEVLTTEFYFKPSQ